MNTFKQYRLALQIFQSNRLRRDYQDLADISQYEKVGEFFFTEIYGPRDFSDRNAGARKIQHLIHMLPGVKLTDIEEVLDLLELTVRLDDELAQLMISHNTGTSFDEATYERLYREANNYDERFHQLELIRKSLYNVFHLSRSHLLGVALHRSRFFAILAGIDAAHGFLVKGYDAVCGVTNIDHFATTIYDRELARLNRIYEV